MSTELIPLTGDPAELSTIAANYQKLSDSMIQAASELADIARDDNFNSQAVVEIRDRSSAASTSMKDVHDRYVGTANALAGYATRLLDAQERANSAIGAHRALSDEITALQTKSTHYQDQANQGGPESLAWKAQKTTADHQVEHLLVELAATTKAYEDAVAEKEAAAQAAISQIQTAVDAHHLNDTLGDVIAYVAQEEYELAQKYVAPVLNWISEIASDVSTVLSIIALIVSCLGFPEVGAALLAVATVLNVIAAVATIVSFLLGGTTVGALVGIALTFVGGKVIDKLSGFASGAIEKTVGTDATKGAEDFIDKGLGAAGEATFDHFVTDPVGGLMTQKLQLMPSDAGGSWNAPPTPQIAHFSAASTSLSQTPILVSAAR